VISTTPSPTTTVPADAQHSELRQRFDQFVGESMFGQMLKSMRDTLSKPAYFHGGRAEEVFQSQLDQLLVGEISKASASQISDPMFELFTANLGNRRDASELSDYVAQEEELNQKLDQVDDAIQKQDQQSKSLSASQMPLPI